MRSRQQSVSILRQDLVIKNGGGKFVALRTHPFLSGHAFFGQEVCLKTPKITTEQSLETHHLVILVSIGK